MNQTLDLNKMNLAPMSNLEMQEIDGGDFQSGYNAGLIVGKAFWGAMAVIGAYLTFATN